MWFLILISWIALIVQILFAALSLAAGLYYLAELVEEYTVVAARVIRYMIFTTMGIYLGLYLFEDLPFSMIVNGLLAQLTHLFLLRRFPFMELSYPLVSSAAFIVLNHYLAFSHFAYFPYPFIQVLGYFTICLWLVPFAFFISLSANENVLPTSMPSTSKGMAGPDLGNHGDLVSHYLGLHAGKRHNLLSVFRRAKETILPLSVKKSKF